MAKILLVEDDEMNRDMLSRRLERRGYEVVCAVNGEQAVAMAQSESPALILMDIGLPPGLDGWEATRRIKATNQTIRIIALTAHALGGEKKKEKRVGRRVFHPKAGGATLLAEKNGGSAKRPATAVIDPVHEPSSGNRGAAIRTAEQPDLSRM